jgi:hypothetical protein
MSAHPGIGQWALALGLALCPALGYAQQHDPSHAGAPPASSALGAVHFPVSCTPEAQAAFDDAMKLQHSFWYQAADQAHRTVLQHDPTCVMALWGRALTMLINPFTPPVPARLGEGRTLLEEAQRIGAKTEREAGLIAALAVLFAGDDLAGHRTRVTHYV